MEEQNWLAPYTRNLGKWVSGGRKYLV